MGLLSDAGVHSHLKHFLAFIKVVKEHGKHPIVLHLFLDGRDVPPQSAQDFLKQLPQSITIGSIHGRFYAMDRDKNWERTKKSYTILTKKQPAQFNHWKDLLHHFYLDDITDEFIPPTQLDSNGIIKMETALFFSIFAPIVHVN